MPLLEQVLKQNDGKIKVVYKNLPLKNHEMATPAALAALAAGRQGKFWEYHDELFADEKLEKEDFIRIAKGLNLDLERFAADLRSPEVRSQLEKDILEAQQLGVSGTPAVYINGRKLKKRSLGGFQEQIDREFEKKP